MTNARVGLVDVDVCQLNGDILRTLQMNRLATARDLRKMLTGVRACRTMVVGDRQCCDGDMLFEDFNATCDQRICVYMNMHEPARQFGRVV